MSTKKINVINTINSAVIITITPIFVLLLSVFLIKEKITSRRIIGIIVGLTGALGLILFANEIGQDAPNIALGNFYILLNAIFYGTYLILAKTLIDKYHPFTFMKWLFSLGLLICLPFGYDQLAVIKWSHLPFEAIWKIIELVKKSSLAKETSSE